MSSLSMALIVGLLAAVAWAWYANMAAREAANHAAREACARLRLVMLDGTVAITRAWPRRDRNGRLRLERTYDFEYTDDGHRRLQGFVVMLGAEVVSVGLAAAGRLG